MKSIETTKKGNGSNASISINFGLAPKEAKEKGYGGKSGEDTAAFSIIHQSDSKPSNQVSTTDGGTIDHERGDEFVGSRLASKETKEKLYVKKSGGDAATPRVISHYDLKPFNQVSTTDGGTIDHELGDEFVGSVMAEKEANGKGYRHEKSGGDAATPHVIAGYDLKPFNQVSTTDGGTIDHERGDEFVGSRLASKETKEKLYVKKSGGDAATPRVISHYDLKPFNQVSTTDGGTIDHELAPFSSCRYHCSLGVSFLSRGVATFTKHIIFMLVIQSFVWNNVLASEPEVRRIFLFLL